MKGHHVLGLAALASLVAGAGLLAAEPPEQAIIAALRHGDCVAAIAGVNGAINSGDARVDFLAGRLIDEGVCVKRDPEAATDYYRHALELGDRNAALDYGAKIGLGEGVEQSYARAGEICRAGGLDAAGQLSAYSLGYACTLRALAGQVLRESLPKGAIANGSGAVVLVAFVPAGGALLIRSTPPVATSEPPTGRLIRKPVIDARKEVERAWKDAVARAPTPDASRLEAKSVDMSLDLDATLEPGRQLHSVAGKALLGGEIVPEWRLHSPGGR